MRMPTLDIMNNASRYSAELFNTTTFFKLDGTSDPDNLYRKVIYPLPQSPLQLEEHIELNQSARSIKFSVTNSTHISGKNKSSLYLST